MIVIFEETRTTVALCAVPTQVLFTISGNDAGLFITPKNPQSYTREGVHCFDLVTQKPVTLPNDLQVERVEIVAVKVRKASS